MGTFILCGLGCYLLFRERRSWTASAVRVSLALSWCVVMAFSRLYLGVHFASDVIAGLLAGAAWIASVRRRSRSFGDGAVNQGMFDWISSALTARFPRGDRLRRAIDALAEARSAAPGPRLRVPGDSAISAGGHNIEGAALFWLTRFRLRLTG